MSSHRASVAGVSLSRVDPSPAGSVVCDIQSGVVGFEELAAGSGGNAVRRCAEGMTVAIWRLVLLAPLLLLLVLLLPTGRAAGWGRCCSGFASNSAGSGRMPVADRRRRSGGDMLEALSW